MAAELTNKIGEIHLLETLSSEEQAAVSSQCRLKRYDKGDSIVEEGSSDQDLYFLLEGRAKVINLSPSGREVGLTFLESGDYFGEFSVIDQKPRSASVECIEPITVAILPYNAAYELLTCHQQIVRQLLVDHIAIIRQQDKRLMELTDVDTPRRIYKLLLKLIHVHPRFQCEPVIHPLPTHHDIAIMTSASRESVSRVLSQLQQDEVTEKSGRYLYIKQIEKLRILAGDKQEERDRGVIADRRKCQ